MATAREELAYLFKDVVNPYTPYEEYLRRRRTVASKHPFPYVSYDSAVQDQFRKLGAEDNKAEAFSLMKIGFYQKQERKLQNTKRQEQADKVEAILELVAKNPNLKKEFEGLLEDQSKKQLGRKSA